MQIPEPRIPRRIKTLANLRSSPSGSHSPSDLRTWDLQYSDLNTQTSLGVGSRANLGQKSPKVKLLEQEFHSFLNSEWKSSWLWARSPVGMRRERRAVNKPGHNVLRNRGENSGLQWLQQYSIQNSLNVLVQLFLTYQSRIQLKKLWSSGRNEMVIRFLPLNAPATCQKQKGNWHLVLPAPSESSSCGLNSCNVRPFNPPLYHPGKERWIETDENKGKNKTKYILTVRSWTYVG